MSKELPLSNDQRQALDANKKNEEKQVPSSENESNEHIIAAGSTPVLDTNRSDTSLKSETHELTVIKWTPELKKNVEEIRQEIVEHYNIPPSNIFIDDFPEGRQRPLRLFIVMLHKEDPKLNVYAEGSIYHAYLYNLVRDKLENNTLPTREYLAKNITKILNGEDESFPFVLHKGFIDIYKNGFQNFPAIRQALEKDKKIQNWFRSG